MKGFVLSLGLAGSLGAQIPMQIVGVERHGLPPYEAADRVYVLNAGRDRGLRAGERLRVKRAGEPTTLGYLRVATVRESRSEASFETWDVGFPMKGDLAFQPVMSWPPQLPGADPEPIPVVALPKAATLAPPQEGVLFFLPQRAEISLAGMRKLEAWAEAWGTTGRWVLQVPATKALRPALQKQRSESIVQALRGLGIEQVAVEIAARTSESRYDPTWILHWD